MSVFQEQTKMHSSVISIRGARTHNLKSVDIDIPRGQFVVITGVSGSGKSSLAFDTVYAEGQRRYLESLSAYARQFVHMMDKPDLDFISGLSPAISLDQRAHPHNPRSTVGTVTEIYDYLRLLFAKIGIPYSPVTGLPIEAQSIDEMAEKVTRLQEGTKVYILAPVIRDRKGEYKKDLYEYRKQGFQRVFVDGVMFDIDEVPSLERYEKHSISLVIDRLVIPSETMQEGAWRTRLVASLETALRAADGIVYIQPFDKKEDTIVLTEKFACPISGFSIEEIDPRLFSFNGPQGACQQCNGLGIEHQFDIYKIIDWSLSIKQGAIRCLTDRKYSVYRLKYVRIYYQKLLEALAEQFSIPATIPFATLSDEQRNIILYGTGDNPVNLKITGNNKDFCSNKPFEGVINVLNKRINEDDDGSLGSTFASIQRTHTCSKCHGARIKPEALSIRVNGKNIAEVSALSVEEALFWFNNIQLSPKEVKIVEKVIQEIKSRLVFLKNVGLDYLTLSRSSWTLSGGESQRIRLASQIGSGLTGVLYVLDEPSIGLHQRDNDRLLGTIKKLRDLGNSVLVVEHDEDAIRQADWLIDMGPAAGVNGGQVMAAGTVEDVLKCTESLTADYLTGRKCIAVPTLRRPINPATANAKISGKKARTSKRATIAAAAWRGREGDQSKWGNVAWLSVENARINNLKNVNIKIPLGRFVCITGVSGSGKSSLILDVVCSNLHNKLNGEPIDEESCSRISGHENLDKIICIDQSPIGRTPRSNPATYVGCFLQIREWFASLPDAKARGYTPGRFSFNIKGGRCETCQGDGILKIGMHFLPNVYVECDQCHGKRYNQETLQVKYRGKSISDVLDMNIDDGVAFFENQVGIWNKLKQLQDVGLGYLSIGHSATLLSGGEAQRVKLAKEFGKKATGHTLYVFDEPTTGLHFDDTRKLVEVLNKLVDQGNSVVIIEHNLDIIKVADWVIDLGPEGGSRGGTIIAEGTPEDIARNTKSHTGQYLRHYVGKGPVMAIA
jgi:excinuclease ABC subunit A